MRKEGRTMRLIDADKLAAHLDAWRRRLLEHGECGGCAVEMIEQVARTLDGWPTVEGAGRYEVMRTDALPPRQEDADAQGCVLAWDAHGSGWVVRHYKNLQGAPWWARMPGAVE